MQAPVEIRYEGAVIGRASEVSGSSEAGDFTLVTTEPMPVGTRLELVSGDEVAFVRVVKVREATESAPAGMAVRPVSASEPLEVLDSALDDDDAGDASASPPPRVRASEESASGTTSTGNGASGSNGHFQGSHAVEGGSSAELQAVGGKKRRRRRR